MGKFEKHLITPKILHWELRKISIPFYLILLPYLEKHHSRSKHIKVRQIQHQKFSHKKLMEDEFNLAYFSRREVKIHSTSGLGLVTRYFHQLKQVNFIVLMGLFSYQTSCNSHQNVWFVLYRCLLDTYVIYFIHPYHFHQYPRVQYFQCS